VEIHKSILSHRGYVGGTVCIAHLIPARAIVVHEVPLHGPVGNGGKISMQVEVVGAVSVVPKTTKFRPTPRIPPWPERERHTFYVVVILLNHGGCIVTYDGGWEIFSI